MQRNRGFGEDTLNKSTFYITLHCITNKFERRPMRFAPSAFRKPTAFIKRLTVGFVRILLAQIASTAGSAICGLLLQTSRRIAWSSCLLVTTARMNPAKTDGQTRASPWHYIIYACNVGNSNSDYSPSNRRYEMLVNVLRRD